MSKNKMITHMKERYEKIRQHNPDRYFGSDLNQFIYKECSRTVIVNNIDLIMWKYRNKKNHLLRVIESKHTFGIFEFFYHSQKSVAEFQRTKFITALNYYYYWKNQND